MTPAIIIKEISKVKRTYMLGFNLKWSYKKNMAVLINVVIPKKTPATWSKRKYVAIDEIVERHKKISAFDFVF